MVWKLHEIRGRWRIEGRVGVKCKMQVGRNLIRVRAGLVRGSQTLRFRPPVNPDAIKILLRGILGRSREVEPFFVRIDSSDLDYIESTRRHQPHLRSIASDHVNVAPAILLTAPQKLLSPPDAR